MTDTRAGLLRYRIVARLVAVVVAVVAGAASFEHIASVARAAGERLWVAYSLPLAIDGLIVVGVMALIEDQRLGRRPRPVARLAVVVGVVGTLAANVASAEPSVMAWLVALAAPVCFLLSVEVLTRSGKPIPDKDSAAGAATSGSLSDRPQQTTEIGTSAGSGRSSSPAVPAGPAPESAPAAPAPPPAAAAAAAPAVPAAGAGVSNGSGAAARPGGVVPVPAGVFTREGR